LSICKTLKKPKNIFLPTAIREKFYRTSGKSLKGFLCGMSFVQAGKTAPAKALTSAVGAIFNRIQITPGLRPADIPGSSIYNPCDAARSGSR
jgi:hypothetical protein